MRASLKRFAFREDAIEWIKAKGFVYMDNFGWVHIKHGMCAIVGFNGRYPRTPWYLSTYKSVVPNRHINVNV
jgi:hypothetical protein